MDDMLVLKLAGWVERSYRNQKWDPGAGYLRGYQMLGTEIIDSGIEGTGTSCS